MLANWVLQERRKKGLLYQKTFCALMTEELTKKVTVVNLARIQWNQKRKVMTRAIWDVDKSWHSPVILMETSFCEQIKNYCCS